MRKDRKSGAGLAAWNSSTLGMCLTQGEAWSRCVSGKGVGPWPGWQWRPSSGWPGSVFPDPEPILELIGSCGNYNTGPSEGA